MANAGAGRKRQRGSVTQEPSGGYRVRVYAGIDAVTGQRHYLQEFVPAGPKATAHAERARTRMVNEVDERRNPKTARTLDQLLDRYFEVLDVEPSTWKTYVGYAKNHIRPALGKQQIGRLDPEDFESLYAELRRCRERCRRGTKHVKHRTIKAHECDEQCRRVPCQPLAQSTVRQIHWILSGSMSRAVRWRWLSVNLLEAAEPPSVPTPNPQPPSPSEAALLINEAWKDPDWGALVWTTVTLAPRRGEICALRRCDVDLDVRVALISAGLKPGKDGSLQRLDTKTHQHRRIAFEVATAEVLADLIARQDARAKQLGFVIAPDAYLFSLAPDCAEPMKPDTVTQRYERMASRLGVTTTFHKLRHYSATELISAGVDVRTVAGRLGHGGGGTTTLRVYAAWVSEADQRAAASLEGRLTKPPRR